MHNTPLYYGGEAGIRRFVFGIVPIPALPPLRSLTRSSLTAFLTLSQRSLRFETPQCRFRVFIYGGEAGIRTPGGLRHNRFRVCSAAIYTLFPLISFYAQNQAKTTCI